MRRIGKFFSGLALGMAATVPPVDEECRAPRTNGLSERKGVKRPRCARITKQRAKAKAARHARRVQAMAAGR